MRMYELLKNAEIADGRLTLPYNEIFPISYLSRDALKSGDNVVLARACTLDLLELFALIADKKIRDENGCGYKIMYIRGASGDGKSRASQLFLHHFVKAGRTVVYEQAEEETVWVFRSDGRCRYFRDSATRCPELEDPTVVHIYDAKATENPREPISVGGVQVVFSSTSMTNLMKQAERNKTTLYAIFPTPTWEEVWTATPLFGELISIVKEAFEKYGGHLRYLFDWNAQKVNDWLDGSLRDLTPDELMTIAQEARAGKGFGSTGPSALFKMTVDAARRAKYEIEFGAKLAANLSDERRLERASVLRDLYHPRNCHMHFASVHFRNAVLGALEARASEFLHREALKYGYRGVARDVLQRIARKHIVEHENGELDGARSENTPNVRTEKEAAREIFEGDYMGQVQMMFDDSGVSKKRGREDGDEHKVVAKRTR